MNKNAPSLSRLIVMVGFAFSCFAILLYLWLSFGGSVPLTAKGYRIHVSFPEATTLAQEAEVRISGVKVGEVKTKELDDSRAGDHRRRARDRAALRAAALGHEGDPAPEDAARRDLRRADARFADRREDRRRRDARSRPGRRHRAARRDLPRLRPEDARGVPHLDGPAGQGSRRPRARPERGARQPAAVRRGRERDPRDPERPEARDAHARARHGRRLRRADRARRPAGRPDLELEPRLPDDRVARPAAGRDVPDPADVHRGGPGHDRPPDASSRATPIR